MASWSVSTVRIVGAAAVCAGIAVMVVDTVTGKPFPIEAVNLTVIAAGCAVMCDLLRRGDPDNNLWRVLLVIAVVGPSSLVLYAVAQAQPDPPALLVGAVWLLDAPVAVPWMLFIGIFPDGHRPLPRWPVLCWTGGALLVAASVVAWWSAPAGAQPPVPGRLPWADASTGGGMLHIVATRTAGALTGLLPLLAAACLAQRYRRSGPVVRQQIRLGVAGLAAGIVLDVVLRTLPGGTSGVVEVAFAVLAVGVAELGVGAALLRWKLWIVDQALPRTVVLGGFSATVTGVIVAVALIVSGRVGTSQFRAALLSAAVVTLLVQGYSRRLEPWVRRKLYGDRPGGFAVLIGLADGLASLDDDVASARIADAARRGLAVPWAALWGPTARPGLMRLAGEAGDFRGPAVLELLPPVDGGRARLLVEDQDRPPLPADAAASIWLSAEHGLWGVVAVGQRRGDPLTLGDLELLSVIAHEADLARSNRLLASEVATSLEQLQARAQDLAESRRRLVAAQDEERRRIERDLHDGAQHELIAVASRLHQMSVDGSADPTLLAELASQAEQAVFALQDLARGIYPSVLTDHGVAAAIRSYARRMPVEVNLVIAPQVAGRRWTPAVEAALYFVAVEAIGNARKHSGSRQLTVTLAERGADVLLELYDNGVGFDPARVNRRSGLQHMADRMAALGGTFTVRSRPEDGTWVTASVAGSGLSDRSSRPAGRDAPPGPGG